tara:strand:+ start:1908 stop:2876 length:969 start_codon:yes stop_codon:yes gene_type:complete
MKVIKIVLSPAQKTKLRKGMKIRINKKNKPVIEGAGIYMLVKPENYNVMTKTFEGKRGREFKLDEEELDINQNPENIQDEEVKEAIEGSGLFSRIRRGFKKLKKFYRNKVRDTKVGSAIRKAVKVGSKVAIKSAINSLAGTPLAPLMPALKLANMKYGEKGIDMAIKKIGLGMHEMVGNGLRLGSGMHQTQEEIEAHENVEELLKQAPDMEGGKMHYGMGMHGDGMHGDGLTVKRGAPKIKRGGQVKLRDDKKFTNFILDKQNMLPVKGTGVRLRGDGLHAGKGLRLGGGNEVIGLDEPPATHAIPKARKLVKTSLLSGKSR